MSNDATADAAPTSGDEAIRSAGTGYEVLRERLATQAADLRARADALNERRKEAYGASESVLLGTARLRTEHNCVAVDMVQVAGLVWVGYHVHLGLRSELGVGDVFQLYRRPPQGDGDAAAPQLVPVAAEDEAGEFLRDRRFIDDFAELQKFYREARLIKLERTETKLFAVFRIGEGDTDLRVFRWALSPQSEPTYIDNRGERDLPAPAQHQFEWTRSVREDHVLGTHPHVNVLDEVFVETVGGDLTIKVEDNTEVGEGIYSEPVQDAKQSLDDARIEYAKVGTLILLRVLPYGESEWRHFVFSRIGRAVQRVDAIAHACVALPEDHGLAFPGGLVLQDGSSRTFEGDWSGFQFDRLLRSPNGEDALFVFHRRLDGAYGLFSYNLIEKAIATPLRCHGYALFGDGTMILARAQEDAPGRVHQARVWSTPFVSAEFELQSREQAAAGQAQPTAIAAVGNADLVRGISDCIAVARAATEEQSDRAGYEGLVAGIRRAVDAHHWLDQAELGNLREALAAIQASADAILDEFDKVVAIRKQAAKALATLGGEHEGLVGNLRLDALDSIDAFMGCLTSLRRHRGQIIAQRDTRFIDLAALDVLEEETVAAFNDASAAAVRFMLGSDAFAPVTSRLQDIEARLADVASSREINPLAEDIEQTSEGVKVLSDVVSGLEVDDPTERTRVLESVSEVFGQLNRVRALVDGRRRTILRGEGEAEFAVQFKLLGQAVNGALGQATGPDECDAQLSRVMVQLEELEASFSEFDEFLEVIAEKRDEIYEAFTTRKQGLLDERERQAGNLEKAAMRIVAGIERRATGFADAAALHAYFASDPMVLKAHDLAEKLSALGDSGRAEKVRAALKTSRQSGLRALRDHADLFEGGDDVIRFGEHRFAINKQPLELTMVAGDGGLWYQLTGTEYREAVPSDDLGEFAGFAGRQLASESDDVYRGEFLAASIWFAAREHPQDGRNPEALRAAAHDPDAMLELVRPVAAERYNEGYERGVHDADAARILCALTSLHGKAGALVHPGRARALSWLFWDDRPEQQDWPEHRDHWARRIEAFGALHTHLGSRQGLGELEAELSTAIRAFAEEHGLPGPWCASASHAAVALIAQVRGGEFVATARADALRDALHNELERIGQRREFDAYVSADAAAARGRPLRMRLHAAEHWARSFAHSAAPELDEEAIAEAAARLVLHRTFTLATSSAQSSTEVDGLLGADRRIEDGRLGIDIAEFLARVGRCVHVEAPAFADYRQTRERLLDSKRRALRLEEFRPRVLSSFVRNRLIDQVYLPMIGANLAKQIGTTGDNKRTDQMGLLLLISPPGYGKTTLMEYVASKLGLVFMKVNGPSLGHGVHSLDPREAPNATARQEVEKINLALEMGDNVMLYLDDIQHTHPELLQKFISLCDGQRRIEGVWNGETRTYDLRGKRMCVVMAGNPYTESGERFQIPDMLANRADTYNLGDVLSGREQVFAMSYLENAITSNAVLAPLAARDPEDLRRFFALARGEEVASTEFAHDYAAAESAEIVQILRHMIRCQALLLRVNLAYIASASMDDRDRTEPPFKLQGSYRNMNKLAEKLVAAMNDEEVDRLLADHYVGEAQTLTSGAEANLLKLRELMGSLDETQQARWDAIRRGFQKRQAVGGADDDPVVRVTGTLGTISDGLRSIQETLVELAAAEPPKPELPQAPVAGGASKDNGPEWLRDELRRFGDALQTLSQPRVELQIDNKAPPGVEELLAQQIAIIERTLVPLVRTATRKLEDRQALESQMTEILSALRGVDDRLRGA